MFPLTIARCFVVTDLVAAIASHLSDLGIESYDMLESIKGLAERMGVEAGSESSDDTPEKTTEMMDAIFAQLSLM